MTRAGHPFLPNLHDYFPARVHLVDHLAGSVDHPYVTLWVHAHRMRAAGIASCRPINCRISRPSWNPIAHRDGRDLSFVERHVVPGLYELPIALEFQKGVSTAMKHQDVALCVDGYSGH